MAYVRSEESKAKALARGREWYAANKERKRAADKKWAENNREKRREASRRWKAKNKDHVLAKGRERKRREYAENPEFRAKRGDLSKAWRAKNREAIRIGKILKNYKISLEEYQALLIRSGGHCEICGAEGGTTRTKHLFVDHNHQNGAVRGLLCQSCNQGLGFLRDDPEILRKAILYLGGQP